MMTSEHNTSILLVIRGCHVIKGCHADRRSFSTGLIFFTFFPRLPDILALFHVISWCIKNPSPVNLISARESCSPKLDQVVTSFRESGIFLVMVRTYRLLLQAINEALNAVRIASTTPNRNRQRALGSPNDEWHPTRECKVATRSQVYLEISALFPKL
jgi:hypothetical protein